mmetsp:Transcript_1912/g.4161  ORF Transcript_1912/g.4161 Transcript_1912/m.4161 type:complete len:141 (+) Transcript_1912:123-545(+)
MQLNTTIILTCLFYSVYSFQLPTGSNESQTHQNNIVAEDISRREFFKYTAASIGVVAGILNPLSANADIVRSPGKCANGEGEGCDSLAGGNEFIRSLQKKSSENREANQRVRVFNMGLKRCILKMQPFLQCYLNEMMRFG